LKGSQHKTRLVAGASISRAGSANHAADAMHPSWAAAVATAKCSPAHRPDCLPTVAAGTALALMAIPPAAQQTYNRSGMLSCTMAPTIGLNVGSQQAMRCEFSPERGPPEYYSGVLSRIGLDRRRPALAPAISAASKVSAYSPGAGAETWSGLALAASNTNVPACCRSASARRCSCG